MTTCAIMQPTYLPWAGYFNLINSVDYFVFLDDVQLERQSWQTRNKYLLKGEEKYMSLPISHELGLSTPMNNISFSNNFLPWQKKTYRKLVSAYQNTTYGEVIIQDLWTYFHNYDYKNMTLSEYNIMLIEFFSKKLGIKTEFLKSSEMDFFGSRSDYITLILKSIGCDVYLSPNGAKNYLKEDKFEEKSGVRLEFQVYNPSSYIQVDSNEFVSHLSIIDVIANIGYVRAKEYIR